jgi:hypothetical protein
MEAVVGDFGFARVLQSESDSGKTQSTIGPIRYLTLPLPHLLQLEITITDGWHQSAL